MKFPATIIFLTVAGEEQGLNGSKHFAQMAKQQGWKIEAVLNNDIVGGDRSPQQDASVVRVFSEGLPAAATEAEIRRIRALGGESDSTSRELARYIADVGRSYDAGVKPLLIFRLDRFLRGGDHYSFNQQGFAAVRFTEFREDYNHQHQNVRTRKRHRIWRPAEVRGLRLRGARGAAERRNPGLAGIGSGAAGEGEMLTKRPG